MAPRITFQRPALTPRQVRLAYAVAVSADLLQLLLGPLGWAGADEIIDIVTMFLTWRVLGFHPLLLPTFVLEFLPISDLLPSWTGCVALVVMLRKHQQRAQDRPPSVGPIIDV